MKHIFVMLLLIVLMIGSVSAATNNEDMGINIVIGEGGSFELELPLYEDESIFYRFWEPTYDHTYFNYTTDNFREHHIFKALKSGQTTITMTLYQCGTDQWGNFPRWIPIKTIKYNINILC
jgi:hypothetical protein